MIAKCHECGELTEIDDRCIALWCPHCRFYTHLTREITITMHDAFKVRMLNEEGKIKAKKIAITFEVLLNELEKIVPAPPPSGSTREMAIVRTKLEEACFFAKKAMANDPANCEERIL